MQFTDTSIIILIVALDEGQNMQTLLVMLILIFILALMVLAVRITCSLQSAEANRKQITVNILQQTTVHYNSISIENSNTTQTTVH